MPLRTALLKVRILFLSRSPRAALFFLPLVSQPGPRMIFRHFFCLCPRVVWTSQFLFLSLLSLNVDFVPLGLNCSQQWKEEASLINESHSSSCDVSHLCLFSHPCPHPAPACLWSRGTPWPSWERLVPWGRWSSSISQREGPGKGRSAGQSPFAYVLSYLPVHWLSKRPRGVWKDFFSSPPISVPSFLRVEWVLKHLTPTFWGWEWASVWLIGGLMISIS